MRRTMLRVLAALAVALPAGCAPWRSDIELTPGVAAAPVLTVGGWQTPVSIGIARHVTFGPWSADRHRTDDGWMVVLRHDSTLAGDARCTTGDWSGEPRRKGQWRDTPLEALTCDLTLPGLPDTMRLAAKADAGHPMAGRAADEDWAFTLRGTDRLRTRPCLVLGTCGWYVELDGADVAAVEADARAWVYISSDLGEEVRGFAALIAGVLLLREDPASHFPRGPQQPMAPARRP